MNKNAMKSTHATKSTHVTKSATAESAPGALSSTAPAAVSPPASTSSKSTALAGIDLPPLGDTTVSECLALIDQIGALLGDVEELSTLDIRHALKMRKGGPQLIPQLADLCTHNGITAVGNMSVTGMTGLLARSNSLSTIAVALAALQKKLDDASFTAESSAWQSATTLYTLLRRMASRSPTLSEALQPIQAFFQTKRTKGNRLLKKAVEKVKAGAKAAVTHPAAAAQAPPASANPAGSTPPGTAGAGGNGAAPVAGPSPVSGSTVTAGTLPATTSGAATPAAAAASGAAHS